MERRTILRIIGLGLPGLLFLPRCGSNSRMFDPQAILSDLKTNEAIGRLRNGSLFFRYREIFSPKGKAALAIVQRGLITLDLMENIKSTEYGIYGDKTALAVNRLQNRAGLEGDGRKFDQAALLALEEALQAKSVGEWRPPAD